MVSLTNPTPKKQTVVSYDEELAQFALQFQTQEKSVGGTFFSLKSGQLSYDGETFPGNEIACIILDGLIEYMLYSSYDPKSPAPPLCFAFGRSEDEMAPHADVLHPRCETCAACPQNQWGTSKNQDGSPGKGKACRNARRLALIPAGSFINGQFQPQTDADTLANAGIAYLKLPVTSVANYKGFIRSISDALQRPPFAVYAKLKVIPDAKTQFKVVFEVLGKVPNELLPTVKARYLEAVKEIEFPYQQEEEKPVAPALPTKTLPRKTKF